MKRIAVVLFSAFALIGAVVYAEFPGGAYGELAGTPPLAYTADIVTKDVFIELLPTTAPSAANGSCFDESANGRLRYTCPMTMQFHVAATVSYHAGAAGDVVRLRCGDNGVTSAVSETMDGVTTTGDSTALHCMLTLSQNEYISIWVANGTDTDDLTIDTLSIFAMAAM